MPALTWKRILASLLPASSPETAVNAVPVLWREWTGKETALGEIPLDKQLSLWSVTRMANSWQNSRDDPSEERSIPPLLFQLSTMTVGCSAESMGIKQPSKKGATSSQLGAEPLAPLCFLTDIFPVCSWKSLVQRHVQYPLRNSLPYHIRKRFLIFELNLLCSKSSLLLFILSIRDMEITFLPDPFFLYFFLNKSFTSLNAVPESCTSSFVFSSSVW